VEEQWRSNRGANQGRNSVEEQTRGGAVRTNRGANEGRNSGGEMEEQWRSKRGRSRGEIEEQ
jgi:hypothetical protein